MKGVICYHTFFSWTKNIHWFYRFALGDNIFLRDVLGLHILLSIDTTLNLPRGKLIFSDLKFTFSLFLDPPGNSLPDGVSLTESNLCVSPGVLSNITSLVLYTDMDDFANTSPNQTTPQTIPLYKPDFIKVMSLEIYLMLKIHCYLTNTPRASCTIFCSNKGGRCTVATSNSEPLRHNLNYKLRSQYKLVPNLILPSYSFNYSNIFSTHSINNVGSSCTCR